MLVGMLSVNAMPVSVALLGLINSILIVEAAPPVTINGSKPFTISIARPAPPVTVRFAVRLLGGTRGSAYVMFAGGMVLVRMPPVLLVTNTSILHRCPARIKPLVSEIVVAPGVGLKTSGGVAPQPVAEGAVELLTVIPAGKLSVIETLVRFVSLGAKISILNLELPPAAIVEGENDFTPLTSVPLIVTLAFAGVRLPTPTDVVKPPAGMVLVSCPEAVPGGTVTGTEMVHVPRAVGLPAGMVPPLKLTLVDVEVTDPPQVLVIVAPATTVNGAGRLSVKAAP